MKKRNRFYLCCFICILLIGASDAADKPLFSLVIASANAAFKLHEPIILRVRVTNTSDRSIAFVRSPGQLPEESFRYQIEVRNQQGRSVDRAKNSGEPTTEISRYAYTLRPDESFEDSVELTRVFDLSRPGKYVVTVSRDYPPAQNLGKGAAKSNPVTIDIEN
jgi:hypothetical protein